MRTAHNQPVRCLEPIQLGYVESKPRATYQWLADVLEVADANA